MSSDRNSENEAADFEETASTRVIETKHVFPEEYECKSCVKKENQCMEPPELDETISRPVTTNKLNQSLRNHKCSHCGEVLGKCQCLSDEARRELIKVHEYKQDPIQKEEEIKSAKNE